MRPPVDHTREGTQAEKYIVAPDPSGHVDPGDARRGGAEGDIRSLFYWSRGAYYILAVAGVLWVVLGAYRLYVGLTWVDLDAMTGSTQATDDLAWASPT